jgi:hypothetical protein
MREEAYAVRRNVDKALVLHTLRRIKFERGRRRTIADERNLDVAERVAVETLADETLRREMRRFDTGHWVDFLRRAGHAKTARRFSALTRLNRLGEETFARNGNGRFTRAIRIRRPLFQH